MLEDFDKVRIGGVPGSSRSLSARKNFKNLQLKAPSAPLRPFELDPPFQNAPLIETQAGNGATYATKHDITYGNSHESKYEAKNGFALTVGLEVDLHIHSSDVDYVSDLGYGNGGTVTQVIHRPSGLTMARKVIQIEANEQFQRMIRKELQTLHVCDSEFIVKYFGHTIEESSVVIYMEYMDCLSLEKVYKANGPIPESILVSINADVVDGLSYLKSLNIIHRDIKPSNILLNRQGDIKLCDFGVSGTLSNSVAETFIGTSTYMSPERIEGKNYSSLGDVWSLGITLVELEAGKYPYEHVCNEEGGQGIFALLLYMTSEPPPKAPSRCSRMFRDYIEKCLQKRPERRSTLQGLTRQPFYALARPSDNRVAQWAATLSL